ncbi:MAG: zinc ribbon domain-containing protein [Phycisphaerae bacterium]|jgi:putative FmdB family regulatory protein
MPIYEYICRSCEHEFERLARSFSDADEVRCPACEGKDVERKLSVFAARQGTPTSAAMPSSPGPCASCGDPNGPCPFSG